MTFPGHGPSLITFRSAEWSLDSPVAAFGRNSSHSRMQPCFRNPQFTLDGADRDSQGFADFINFEAAKIVQFDNLSLARTDFCQLVQGLVQRNQLRRASGY